MYASRESSLLLRPLQGAFLIPPVPPVVLINDLKGNVHEAGLPEHKEQLRSRVQRFMRRLFSAPEHVMSYLQHPCVQYAAST